MKIFVARHGETDFNQKGIINDDPSREVSLNLNGIRQSEKLAEELKDKKLDVIFVSEFARSKQTAEIINRHHSAPIKVDLRINERTSGFDGRPASEFAEIMAGKDENFAPENGESMAEEKERIFRFLDEITQMGYKSVLIVNHGDNMVIMRGYFKNLPIEDMWGDFYPKNCELLEFEI